MSVETDTFTALGALVANRAYPVLAPEAAVAPFIVFQRTSAPREGTLNKSVRVSNPQLIVNYFAETRDAARTLANSGAAAMKTAAVINDLVDDTELYDPEVRLFYVSATYSCWETE